MTRKLALAGLALVLVTSAPSAQAAFPGANGRIAFGASAVRDDAVPPTSSRSIDDALPSGAGRRPLRACTMVQGEPDRGDCGIEYRSPAWSPRGTTLAFDAGARLAVMRSDGTGFRLLPQQTADDGEPAWSPGGTRLVFSGAGDLYVMNVKTGRVRRLTFRGGRAPAWSERGRIAFVRGSDVYTVRASGRGLRRVTYRRGTDPEWSPHGSKLMFSRQRPGGPFSLYVVRASGRGLKRLPTGQGADSPRHPSWSPDGRWVAYESFDSGVWAQRLTGTGVRQVAGGGVGAEYAIAAFAPDWQPRR
jgi:Tol biopolymer transport system component